MKSIRRSKRVLSLLVIVAASVWFAYAQINVTWKSTDLRFDQKASALQNQFIPSAGRFADDRNGWFVGSNGLSFGKIRAVVGNTRDSGNSWTVSLDECRGSLNDIRFRGPLTGWIVGYCESASGKSSHSVIRRTIDGGRTWSNVDLENLFPEFDSDYLNAITFISDDVGFAVGTAGIHEGRGFLLQTQNGGKNWERKFLGEVETAFNDIAFSNSGRVGYVVGETSQIFVTRDFGKSWQRQFLSREMRIFHVAVVDDESAWATCDNGTVLRTVNSGKTWEILNPPSAYKSLHKKLFWFSGILATDQTNVIVSGSYGTVFYTNDGGRTWNYTESPNVEFTYGFFGNKRSVFLLGKAGRILVSRRVID